MDRPKFYDDRDMLHATVRRSSFRPLQVPSPSDSIDVVPVAPPKVCVEEIPAWGVSPSVARRVSNPPSV